jgi:hypothetical protein
MIDYDLDLYRTIPKRIFSILIQMERSRKLQIGGAKMYPQLYFLSSIFIQMREREKEMYFDFKIGTILSVF